MQWLHSPVVKKKPYLPDWLLIVPSGHSKQSKQHSGFLLFMAFRVPGGHGSLQRDLGT